MQLSPVLVLQLVLMSQTAVGTSTILNHELHNDKKRFKMPTSAIMMCKIIKVHQFYICCDCIINTGKMKTKHGVNTKSVLLENPLREQNVLNETLNYISNKNQKCHLHIFFNFLQQSSKWVQFETGTLCLMFLFIYFSIKHERGKWDQSTGLVHFLKRRSWNLCPRKMKLFIWYAI